MVISSSFSSSLLKKKMNSKKKKMIQPRPVPPDLESIRKDLENAPRDDVAFTFFNVASNDADSPSTESERVVAGINKLIIN